MYLISTGMVSSVGLSSAAACAAMRAGVAIFEELSYTDNREQPIVGAAVPGLDSELKRDERVIELLTHALADCLVDGHLKSYERVPLLVGLAEPERPGGSADLADYIVGEMERRLEVRFHPQLSCAIPYGHVSGFEALRAARELLQDPSIPACLVCGVDSNINASSLHWLDQHGRLKTEENSDGVIPGEAGAALLVQREVAAESKTLARLIGLGFGHERASVLSEEPLLGLGLTEAARAALAEAGIQMHEIGFRLSDVTGESYGFKEQALVVARLLRVHREDGCPIWHCAENLGDTGAAAGIIQMIMVFHAYQKSYAPGNIAMCFTSAASGRRAVALLASNPSTMLER